MKNLIGLLCLVSLVISCSKDSISNLDQLGNFKYSVSGAVSKTISGEKASFGFVEGGALADKTFINLVVGSDVLNIDIFAGLKTGTYIVNPKTIKDENGNIVFLEVKENDSQAAFATGSSFTNDHRSFSTHSADGGRVTITTVGENSIQGNFNMSLMELVGGDGFSGQKAIIQGSFTAITK